MSGASCALRALLKPNPDQRGGEYKGCWLHPAWGPRESRGVEGLIHTLCSGGAPGRKGWLGRARRGHEKPL